MKIKNCKLKVSLAAISYLLFAASPTHAQVRISDLTPPGWLVTPSSIGDLFTRIKIIPFIFFVAGAIFLYNLLSAGWAYVTSTGDAKKIADATQRLINSFLGIVLVLASFVIVRIMLAILGLPGLI